ncbi:MAG TPA: hypothetical protein GX524_08035 [Firmicutes bacterium]|nr:hypothetical protein [Bacillota bacterium]
MEITIQKAILCAVTDDPAKIQDIPAFIVKSKKIRQEKAMTLSRILQGAVHDTGDGVLIVVKH